MQIDSERRLEANLNAPLTRRDILRGSAASALAWPEAFTAEIQESYSGFPMLVAIEAVNDPEGNTAAVYSLLQDSQVQKVDFEPQTGTYELSEKATDVPLKISSSIVGFPNRGREGQELIVVGGYDFTDPASRHPSLAISEDSGESFEPFTLRDARGEILSGEIAEMKRVPLTDKVLLLLTRPRSTAHQYGLFDTKTGEFSVVAAESEDLPLLDDLYVNPANPDMLLGCGRVVRTSKRGDRRVAAINDFELDLTNAAITSGGTFYEDLPVLEDVHLVRDENGRIKTAYVLQTIQEGGFIFARQIHKINYDEDPKRGHHIVEYGPLLDSMLTEALVSGTPFAQEFVKYGVTVVLKNIHPLPQGAWAMGQYRSVNGQGPIALYWQHDEETIVDPESVRMYAFEGVRIIPADIAQEPKFVAFGNGDEDTAYGVLLNLQSAGAWLLEAHGDYSPTDTVLSLKRTRE